MARDVDVCLHHAVPVLLAAVRSDPAGPVEVPNKRRPGLTTCCRRRVRAGDAIPLSSRLAMVPLATLNLQLAVVAP